MSIFSSSSAVELFSDPFHGRSSQSSWASTPASHSHFLLILQPVCKKATATDPHTKGDYGAKRLPRRAVKQLPVFPEMLAGQLLIQQQYPYPGTGTLTPIDACHVAVHLCPCSTSQLSASSSRHLMLPTKPEQFESALSTLSILTSYQEDWFGQPLMSRMLTHGRKWQSLLTCPSISSMSQSRPRARLW